MLKIKPETQMLYVTGGCGQGHDVSGGTLDCLPCETAWKEEWEAESAVNPGAPHPYAHLLAE